MRCSRRRGSCSPRRRPRRRRPKEKVMKGKTWGDRLNAASGGTGA